MIPEKRCTKCKEIKPINEFYFDNRRKDGHGSHCKECNRKRENLKYKANPERKIKNSLMWVKNNPERAKVNKTRWYETHKEESLLKVKIWKRNNRKKVSESLRLWRKNHPDKARILGQRADIKKRSTPKGRLRSNMSGSICKALHGNKKNKHWESMVGYTVEHLMKHLEKQFQEGMSWDNYGEWHIDHKIPVSVFNFKKPQDDDFKRCWSLANLQPLWAMDNWSKHDRLETPFQPHLSFG